MSKEARLLVDDVLRDTPPAFNAFYLEEPRLVFGGGELSVDPKAGIERFGPYGSVAAGTRRVRLGVIGTGEGIQAFLNFLNRSQSRIQAGFNKRGKPLDLLAFPDFPGCSPDQTFRTEFTCDFAQHRKDIPEELFRRAVLPALPQTKIEEVVKLVQKRLETLAEMNPKPDVVVLLMPPIVEKECAAIGSKLARTRVVLSLQERLQRKLVKQSLKTGQGLLELDFDSAEPEMQAGRGFYNIHHALKAHAMRTGLTTQVVWESTLANEHLSSVAWNLFTALYYKAGNTPWRLQTLPEGTCFVGVSFYKESPHANADMQTSLAQVFGAGEGMVLKGEKAVVDKKRDSKPHLDLWSSERLLKRAIALYTKHHDEVPPKRVVIHKSSRFWPEERDGFMRALGGIYRYDFLTLESLHTQFMRLGKKPPLRGTVIQLAPKRYLFFGNGYVPYLRSYPGKRVPQPLEIIEHHGVSAAETVCQELLALTKLNWNSCAFGSSLPITMRFAKDVGKILSEMPKGQEPQTRHQFYM